MNSLSQIEMLNLIMIGIIAIIGILSLLVVFIVIRMRLKEKQRIEENSSKIIGEKNNNQIKRTNLITRDGKEIDSIYKFMEFDSITDNMIIRKNREQFIMVIECKGINYDLLSNDEKSAVELGFISFLNTIRTPIQLYVQTRKLDMRNLLSSYSKRTDAMLEEVRKIDAQIQLARQNGNEELTKRLLFDRKRKMNIVEYSESIEEYTNKINDSQYMLQQKTYIIVSYYANEIGDTKKYSDLELNDLVFSELFTRTQTIVNALTSSEITGKVLNSEELAELLYVAYNRESSDTYTLKNALDAQYDRLYSTAKDVLETRKQELKKQIEKEAIKLATNSITKADEQLREERKIKATEIRKKAENIMAEYKDDLSKELYDKTIKEIREADINTSDIIDIKPKIRKITGVK
ncbi:MAG: hypothetical protein HXK66_03120 [Clostridiales bacterium]|nr:hypothetical protein [Clostridiales bacterium]MBB1553329.1 hypothetical protein [Clostridiales bacterium]MBF0979143.1 hypothetical protein [Clostridiales bacterium]MBF0985831.1 hypothetical protein [Clostridiales bacterium]